MIRIGLLLHLILFAAASTGSAQNTTLQPGSLLRYTFNVNPSAWNSNTPDVIRLGVYGPAVMSSTPATLTASLYDGSTLLGTVSAKPLTSTDLPGLVSFYWKSPTSDWAEKPLSTVNFTSVLNGSIQGRIDLSGKGGSVMIPPPVGDPGGSGFNCCIFMMYRNPAGTWDAIPGAVTNVAQFLVDQINVTDHLNFQISDKGAASIITDGSGRLAIGYGRVVPDGGMTAPSGVAIFGERSGSTLISEAGVPASPLIQNGRIYAEVSPNGFSGRGSIRHKKTPFDGRVTTNFTTTKKARILRPPISLGCSSLLHVRH